MSVDVFEFLLSIERVFELPIGVVIILSVPLTIQGSLDTELRITRLLEVVEEI